MVAHKWVPANSPVSLAHRRFGLGWTKGRRRALLVMTGIVAVAALAFTSSDVRWRVRLLYARSHGEYREIPFLDFVKWLKPHSIVNLFPLFESGNVRAAIRNELTDDATAEQGLQLFAYHCARCHGEKGAGAAGPSLVASIARNSDWNFFATVKWGRPGTLMLAQPLTDRENLGRPDFRAASLAPVRDVDGGARQAPGSERDWVDRCRVERKVG